jgi:hypothetical protein
MHMGCMIQIRVELTYIPMNYYLIKSKTQKDLIIVSMFSLFYLNHQESLNNPLFLFIFTSRDPSSVNSVVTSFPVD